MNRPAQGAFFEKVAASATAKTVPGRAHGTAISVSIGPLQRDRRETARRAAPNPSASAAAVATAAIQREFAVGRRRSGSEKSAR
jgi:hypothetical protein